MDAGGSGGSPGAVRQAPQDQALRGRALRGARHHRGQRVRAGCARDPHRHAQPRRRAAEVHRGRRHAAGRRRVEAGGRHRGEVAARRLAAVADGRRRGLLLRFGRVVHCPRRDRPVDRLRQGACGHLRHPAVVPGLRLHLRLGVRLHARHGHLRVLRGLPGHLPERRHAGLRHGLRVRRRGCHRVPAVSADVRIRRLLRLADRHLLAAGRSDRRLPVLRHRGRQSDVPRRRRLGRLGLVPGMGCRLGLRHEQLVGLEQLGLVDEPLAPVLQPLDAEPRRLGEVRPA